MGRGINIFIGGSIDKNISASYFSMAFELGKKISERDYKIIFDGCSGLPSVVFEAIDGYDRAIIYCTEQYRSDHINKYYNYLDNGKVSQVVEVKSQSQMTDTIIDSADAFIFMKGQMGTLEEVFRVVNSKKNGEHNRPIVIFNVNNEWNSLADLLASCDVDECYYVTDNVIDGLNYIENELFKETSDFYKSYVSRGCSNRVSPIVEEPGKKLLK